MLEYKYIWYKKWGNYKQGIFQPYLLACQLPKVQLKELLTEKKHTSVFCIYSFWLGSSFNLVKEIFSSISLGLTFKPYHVVG